MTNMVRVESSSLQNLRRITEQLIIIIIIIITGRISELVRGAGFIGDKLLCDDVVVLFRPGALHSSWGWVVTYHHAGWSSKTSLVGGAPLWKANHQSTRLTAATLH